MTAAPSMSFKDAVETCLNKYFDFSGRAGRREFWFFVLFSMILNAGASLLAHMAAPYSPKLALAITFISIAGGLYLLIPYYSVLVRRLHDTGRSAWWLLLLPIPIAGAITIIVFACRASQPGVNNYGPMCGGQEHAPRLQTLPRYRVPAATAVVL